MARGGNRGGAGRPKGAQNRRTKEIAEAITKTGITPLEYMMKVMRDPKADRSRRDDMARAAAPYMHPRLQTMTVQGDPTAPLTIQVVTGIPLPVEKKPGS